MSISLQQQAYRYIQEKILSGDLAEGSQVSELSLAREIGISRTPVRDAITQLQTEGFLDRVPRYGTVVRTLRRQEIIELYELREALECYAVELAAHRARPEDLRTLRWFCLETRLLGERLRESGMEVLDSEMMRRFLALDLGFHLHLIKAIGNQRILRTVVNLHVIRRLLGEVRVGHDLRTIAISYRFHRCILRAVERSDPEAARRWMSRHIRRSKEQRLRQWELRQIRISADSALYEEIPDEIITELNQIEAAIEPNGSRRVP